MTINGKVETEGDRFAELLGMEWRKQVEAAAALGVHQGTISSLVKAEEISKTRLNKYAPILREHNLNPEYVKNPFAPRRLTADSSLDITEVKRQIEGLKQQLSALEQSVGG